MKQWCISCFIACRGGRSSASGIWLHPPKHLMLLLHVNFCKKYMAVYIKYIVAIELYI